MNIEKNLCGERLIIRNYVKDDLSFSTGMWFDEENGRYMSDPTRDFVDETYQKALDGLQDSTIGYYLIITLKDSDERIGTCCMFPDQIGTVYDIGYCIHKDYWQRGYAAEAVRLLLQWIRKNGGHKVTAEVAVDNAASDALLRKCGFEIERESEFKKYNTDIHFKSYIYGRTFENV